MRHFQSVRSSPTSRLPGKARAGGVSYFQMLTLEKLQYIQAVKLFTAPSGAKTPRADD